MCRDCTPTLLDCPSRKNLPEENKLLFALDGLERAAQRVRRRHGQKCKCSMCHDIEWMLLNLAVHHDMIQSVLQAPPRRRRRYMLSEGRAS